jgi:murein DD-endopeptidase MepM/ murein hydrolase activator NlpD
VQARSVPKPFGRPADKRPRRSGGKIAVSPLLLYGGFALLVGTNVLSLIGLLMAPDVARLLAGGNTAAISAYEERIAQLRLDVDRLQSRHYAQTGDINLQLQELQQQQELLVEQHEYVKQLADKAAALGIDTPAAGPATDPVLTGSIGKTAAAGDPASEVAAATASVSAMMDDSRLALATLSDEATSKTDRIVDTLAGIGIRPDLPADDDAEGGPLLPPVEGPDSPSLVDDANAVASALERYAAARDAANLAPVHKPLVAATRISSIFGNRKDPFTGRLAFPSGIDFAAPRGTTVLSAGEGKVIFVGQIRGYGNVVEVDHGNGLVTLYGHLSAFIVKKGDAVNTGTPIAKVGSTGRSTGPHLHFEVRRADTAVDPARYLAAGKVLQKVLAG